MPKEENGAQKKTVPLRLHIKVCAALEDENLKLIQKNRQLERKIELLESKINR